MSVDPEILDTFLDESEEHLNSINNLLVDLEESGFDDEEKIDELLRELHSLKGSARMVGVESIEEVVHAAETIIENILEGDEEYTPHMMDMFFEITDDIQTALDEMVAEQAVVEAPYLDVLMDKLDLFLIEDDSSEDTEESETTSTGDPTNRQELMDMEYRELQSLAKEMGIRANQSHEDMVEAILEERQDADPSTGTEGENETEPDRNSNVKGTSPTGGTDFEEPEYELWDPNQYEDMIDDFLAESREMLNKLTNALIDLEEKESPERIDAIFRVAHTLKGSSGMINLQVLEDLAHDMEELLDDVRGGELEISSELIDLLLLCNDKIEEILESVENLETVDVRVGHLLHGLEQFEEEGSANLDEIRLIQEGEEPDDGAQADETDDSMEEDDSSQDRSSISESIRVDINKLDNVINLVGELVINRGSIEQKLEELEDLELEIEELQEKLANEDDYDQEEFADDLDLISRAFDEINSEVTQSSDEVGRVVSNLQESVMRTRMVPVAQLFNKFPRLVRDLSRQTGKEVNLEISGKETEMDKTVIEKIGDPLMHIIRNSVDHGIESPEKRKGQGKSEEGTLSIDAGYEGDLVVISIEDDGGGIDTEGVKEKALNQGLITKEDAKEMSDDEIHQLIFEPGFSTKEEVSETSGRGVGMDVVRSNIRDLNGSVEMESTRGEGTSFTIKLPLTVAIIQVLLVRIGERRFAMPLSAVKESVRIGESEIREIGQQEVFELRGRTLSLLRLRDVLGYPQDENYSQDLYPVVVVQSGNQLIGILVEELIQKQEIVIKDLGTVLNDVKFASGATIMGDGSVVLILDVGEIVQDAEELQSRTYSQTPEVDSSSDEGSSDRSVNPRELPKVLAVEDTATQRKMMEKNLESSGFDVTTADDGQEALEKARDESFDVIASDIKMPMLDGYELTEELRSIEEYATVPILLISSLDEKIDKMRGFDAGADDYLEKPYSSDELAQKIDDLMRSVG